MQLLKLKSRLHRLEYFADFAKEFELGDKDLVITNEFLYEPFMKSLGLKCHFVMQEKYGLGEPSDEMMNSILAATSSGRSGPGRRPAPSPPRPPPTW